MGSTDSSNDGAPQATWVRKVWQAAKGLTVVLAALGGGYGTFGTADEGAVRDVLTETLNELDDLREELQELRRLRDADRRQWSEFLLQNLGSAPPALPTADPSPDMGTSMGDSEGNLDVEEVAADEAPAPKAKRHSAAARQMLEDL